MVSDALTVACYRLADLRGGPFDSMLIVCPNCATSYQVEPSSLGATGRSVRCVRCQKVWFASNTEAMAEIALSHHRDLAALASAGADAMAPEDPPMDGTPGAAEAAAAEPLGKPPTDQWPAEALARDDRGPAPLPEPNDYELPSQPVEVHDAPALVPSKEADEQDSGLPAAAATPEDIESVAARRIKRPPPRRKASWRVPGWSIAILLLLAINIALIAFRADIVRRVPQTAGLYAAIGFEVNLRGLVFTELVTRKEAQDGTPLLVVEGVIKSVSKRETSVPRLRFAVRDAKGHEVYSWTALPAQNALAPGASMPFRSRLASPPPEAQAVLVRFFNRRDLVAGVE
jgi:predicted Zn finger-like uncharacterized protein